MYEKDIIDEAQSEPADMLAGRADASVHRHQPSNLVEYAG